MNTDDLITRLAADARPVTPVHAGRRAMLWLAFALAVVTATVLWHGLRPDLSLRLELPTEQIQWLSSLATGILAAIAAARLAEPGRPAAWALLPVPAVVVWVAGMGFGCLADIARLGADALVLGTSWSCLKFIVGVGAPLLAVLLYLLRDGGSLRPGRVSAMAGLAAAALCSAGLSLFHHLDAALMILVWHGMAVAIVCGFGAVMGRVVLAR